MPNADANRVVITGMGAVTDLGLDASSTWEGMREGRNGVSTIDDPEFEKYSGWAVTIGGAVRGLDLEKRLDKREARKLDRATQLGAYAADEAIEHSGIDFSKEDRTRCGVIFGSGVGGIGTIEQSTLVLAGKGPSRINPFTVPRLMVNATSGTVSIRYGLEGPASAHATACASSGHAIGDAMQYLRRGDCDVMVVGGAEAALTPLCIGAFMTMKALSARNDEPAKACRPFDVDRDGFILAEGAASYVLETEAHAKARGATIFAELVGFGNSCDAYHITGTDPNGRGASRAMQWALRDAGLNSTDIDYVNAHGTSTPIGDASEVAAAISVFGDHALPARGGKLLMSSTKSMHGHALGASGAVELIACVHAVRDGVVAPTINLENPGTRDAEGNVSPIEMDLVAHEARQTPVKYAMNNTFGFGGHNVTLITARYND